MNTSSFERLSRSICVRDLCEEITTVVNVDPEAETVSDLAKEASRSGTSDYSQPILLRLDRETDEDELSGAPTPFAVFFPQRAFVEAIDKTAGGELFLDYSLLDEELLEDESNAVCVFNEKRILPGDVSLWDLLSSESFALGSAGAVLILRGISTYGVITLDTFLHRPEAKACWLIAALELEAAAAAVCRKCPRESLNSLADERRSDAIKRFTERLQRVEGDKAAWLVKLTMQAEVDMFLGRTGNNLLDALAVDYTMFADKKKMLLATKGGFTSSKSRIKKIFEVAEKLRNWCAHPTPEPEFDILHFSKLRSIVMDIYGVTRELVELARRND